MPAFESNETDVLDLTTRDEPALALLESLSPVERETLTEFRLMGFALIEALGLVGAQAPWFRVKVALRQGCSPELALAIWT